MTFKWQEAFRFMCYIPRLKQNLDNDMQQSGSLSHCKIERHSLKVDGMQTINFNLMSHWKLESKYIKPFEELNCSNSVNQHGTSVQPQHKPSAYEHQLIRYQLTDNGMLIFKQLIICQTN